MREGGPRLYQKKKRKESPTDQGKSLFGNIHDEDEEAS